MSRAAGDQASKRAESIEVLTRKTLVYRLIRTLCRIYLGGRHRMLVEGREHLPRKGGALLVANHQSFLDIPLVAAASPRHVSFVARKSLGDSKPLAWVMRQCGATLIERGAADRRALREIDEHLSGVDLVTMYPEGTRTTDGTVGEFKGGFLVAARRAGVPLVPIAITGSHAIWPRGRRWPGPGRIALRFFPPIDPGGPEALAEVRRSILEGAGEGPAGGHDSP